MTRKQLLKNIAHSILDIQKSSPVLIGINGVDGSGKTFFAKELEMELINCGREIIVASIDDFHNPKEVRYSKGENSPIGYYNDSFNINKLKDVLLNPLSSGNLNYKTKSFDHKTDSEIVQTPSKSTKDAILIMEGIFLFREELVDYWDLKIFLEVDFEYTVPRAIKRDKAKKETIKEQVLVNEKYLLRYIPGQQMYLKEVQPKLKADVVIDNSIFNKPKLLVQ